MPHGEMQQHAIMLGHMETDIYDTAVLACAVSPWLTGEVLVCRLESTPLDCVVAGTITGGGGGGALMT